jgi:arylformamidase
VEASSVLTYSEADPDRQVPMPFRAAEDYARTVMTWARDLPQHTLQVDRGIAYGPHRLQRYDVFRPHDARHAPVVVFWHGGGWTNGYRDYNAFMAPVLAGMGCVLVSPSYRLVHEARLPAAYKDGLAMLAHVAQAAGGWGADAGRLFLGGHSAGAHLASLVALRAEDRTRCGIAQGSVRACLPVSGIMDLHHAAPPAGSLEERVYTQVLERPELDAALSPICWTAHNRVPFSLWVGEHDSERVRRSNARMLELLKLQPGGGELNVLPGQDHFQAHLSLRHASHPWYARLARFIEETA